MSVSGIVRVRAALRYFSVMPVCAYRMRRKLTAPLLHSPAFPVWEHDLMTGIVLVAGRRMTKKTGLRSSSRSRRSQSSES